MIVALELLPDLNVMPALFQDPNYTQFNHNYQHLDHIFLVNVGVRRAVLLFLASPSKNEVRS